MQYDIWTRIILAQEEKKNLEKEMLRARRYTQKTRREITNEEVKRRDLSPFGPSTPEPIADES